MQSAASSIRTAAQLRPARVSWQREIQQLWRQSASYASSAKVPVVPLWIDGRAITQASGNAVIVKHSQTGQPSCEVTAAGRSETEQAVQASWRAFEQWRDVSGWERKKVLVKALSLLEERSPVLATALAADAAFSEIVIGADKISAMNITDGAALTAVSTDGWIPPTLQGNLAMVLRQPYGPVLSIPAFNFPLTLALRSIVYPIACGNTVIMKSSLLIPQVHQLLAPLLEDAGLPKGVLQILNFSETDVAQRIQQLIAHPSVRLVNFTGSTKVGRAIARSCAEHLKPSVLELGGKAAAVVLPSADIKVAANNVLFGAMLNSGQICMSTERVFVHQDIADAFEAELVNAAKSIEQRPGFELVRPGAPADATSLVRDAVKQGARLIHGPVDGSGAAASASRSTFTPHVLADVPTSARLATEEAFAPVLTVSRFASATEAMDQVHALPLGLTTAIFGSLEEALPLARRVESGAVHLNGMTVHDQHALPFGGVKESGWGRFNGRGAIEAFTWTKNITFNDPHDLPLQAL